MKVMFIQLAESALAEGDDESLTAKLSLMHICSLPVSLLFEWHIKDVAVLGPDVEFCAVRICCMQETQGHGPPNFNDNILLNLSAGPNFIFRELVKWSSVNKGNPAPSIHWSLKFYKNILN